MLPEVREYLQDIKSRLRLNPKTAEHVIEELHTHIEEKSSDLELEGSSEKEAARLAIESCGQAGEIARLMYEAFAQGSWSDAGLAALPHLVVAWLFASHLWRNTAVEVAAVCLIVTASLLGWRRGRPDWVYTWLGYLLTPLLVIVYLTGSAVLHYLASPAELKSGLWSPFFAAVLLLGALFGFCWSVRSVIKRDWVLASLMLLPLPAGLCWLIALQPPGTLFTSVRDAPLQIDAPVALTGLLLAAAALLFVRQRTRGAKIVTLLGASAISLPLIAHNLWHSLGSPTLIFLALLAALLCFLTQRLEALIGHQAS